ncbi:MAG: hypothetical protein H8D67_22950 [Deltaproteobacteria bacterium]|nr:hypothetical protein [Deltaproteobacteria bacterium]
MGETTELEFSKEVLKSQMLRKIADVLFKSKGPVPVMGFGQAQKVAQEMLAAINLFESDTVLSLYALWLAERLKPPCSDEYWQHTLELIANSIAEAWRLSGASSLTSEGPPMFAAIEGILKIGKVHEN